LPGKLQSLSLGYIALPDLPMAAARPLRESCEAVFLSIPCLEPEKSDPTSQQKSAGWRELMQLNNLCCRSRAGRASHGDIKHTAGRRHAAGTALVPLFFLIGSENEPEILQSIADAILQLCLGMRPTRVIFENARGRFSWN
jgi:hypothetical protein